MRLAEIKTHCRYWLVIQDQLSKVEVLGKLPASNCVLVRYPSGAEYSEPAERIVCEYRTSRFKRLLARLGLPVLCCLFLVACDRPHGAQVVEPPDTYQVCIIEGCEYLRFYTHNSNYVLTHKGNCNNPIHAHNQ